LLPISDALNQVHANGKVHRDISPDNIMIREDGSPVLLDFGNVREALQEVADANRTRQNTRTKSAINDGYSPFELYGSAKSDFGPETDIYSLSATIYFAISGVKPVPSPERVFEEAEESISATDLKLNGPFPKSFLKTIDKGMMARKAERPQSIGEFLYLLDNITSDNEFKFTKTHKRLVMGLVVLLLLGGIGQYTWQKFNPGQSQVETVNPIFQEWITRGEVAVNTANDAAEKSLELVESAKQNGLTVALSESALLRARTSAQQASEELKNAEVAAASNDLTEVEAAILKAEESASATLAALQDVTGILDESRKNRQQIIFAEVQRTKAAANAAELNVQLASSAIEAAVANGGEFPGAEEQLEIARSASQDASQAVADANLAADEGNLDAAIIASRKAEEALEVTENTRAKVNEIIATAQGKVEAAEIAEAVERAQAASREIRETSVRAVDLVGSVSQEGIDLANVQEIVEQIRKVEERAKDIVNTALNSTSVDAAVTAALQVENLRTESLQLFSQLEDGIITARDLNVENKIAIEVEVARLAAEKSNEVAVSAIQLAEGISATDEQVQVAQQAASDAQLALADALTAQENKNLDAAIEASNRANEARKRALEATRKIREIVSETKTLAVALLQEVEKVQFAKNEIDKIIEVMRANSQGIAETEEGVNDLVEISGKISDVVNQVTAAQADQDIDAAESASIKADELLVNARSLQEELNSIIERVNRATAEANRPVLLASLSVQDRTNFYRGLFSTGILKDPEIDDAFLRNGTIDDKIQNAIQDLNIKDSKEANQALTFAQFSQIAKQANGPTPWEFERTIPLIHTISRRSLWAYGINRQLGLFKFGSIPNVSSSDVVADRQRVAEFQSRNGYDPTGFFRDENELIFLLSRPYDISVKAQGVESERDWYFSEDSETCIIWTYANKIEGVYLRPDAPTIVIQKRKNEETSDLQISIGSSNAFAESNVSIESNRLQKTTLRRAGNTFTMNEIDGFADTTVMKMLFNSRSLIQKGVSPFGGELNISYSARGFTKTFEKVEEACSFEIGFWKN